MPQRKVVWDDEPEQKSKVVWDESPGSATEAARSGPLARVWAGAAREQGVPPEWLPPGTAPELPKEYEDFFTRLRENPLIKYSPVHWAMFQMLEPSIKNIVGQAAAGNIPGAMGAAGSAAATLGIPQRLVAGARALRLHKPLQRHYSLEAERQMGRVFAPTGKIPKAISESKVVPGALERGLVAGTFRGLESKVAANVIAAGDALEAAWKALPQGTMMDATPVWKELQEAISKNVYVKGTKVIENADLLSAYKERMNKLAEIAIEQVQSGQPGAVFSRIPGREQLAISAESARHWRQLMDKKLAPKGFFAIDKAWVAADEAKGVATNALRAQLAKEHPNIAAINADFNFWRNAQQILSATGTRRMGQEKPLSTKIVLGLGAAAGLVTGGPSYAILDAALLAGMNRAFLSTGWRTVSANIKHRLAKALAEGDITYTAALVKQINLMLSSKAFGQGAEE